MTDLLVSARICAAFVGIAIAIVLSSYLFARKVLSGDAERMNEAVSAVGTRLATLYGLILALVHAQDLSDYKDIRSALVDEAVATADVSFSNPFQEPARIEPLAFERLQLDFTKPLPKPASAGL
jgi:hypothetical protein